MAGKENTAARVEKIIAPYVEQLGLDLWDIRFVKEGSEWYLRIFIDKEGGVSIDDCVDLTHAITKPLDDEDPISQSYTLEVSSPGIERELLKDSHFEKNIGRRIMLRLIRAENGVRDYCGELSEYNSGELKVKLDDGETIAVNRKDTSFIKLDDFDINDFD